MNIHFVQLDSGAITQWIECRPYKSAVPGSIPGCPTLLRGCPWDRPVAPGYASTEENKLRASTDNLERWRNGRRGRLKISWSEDHAGSIPARSTNPAGDGTAMRRHVLAKAKGGM